MLNNVKWGLLWGLAFGAFFSLWAMVVFAVSGTRSFDRLGTTLPGIVTFYLFGGIAAGGVVGLLRPLATRSVLGAVCVGIVAAVPLVIAFRITSKGFTAWTAVDTIAFVISTIVVGVGGGLIFGSDRRS